MRLRIRVKQNLEETRRRHTLPPGRPLALTARAGAGPGPVSRGPQGTRPVAPPPPRPPPAPPRPAPIADNRGLIAAWAAGPKGRGRR
ncbi:actin nucleation-promoting factor WASL-like [Mesoplodon densirostris]|uniref:actin nucleation-promoting factor WASL-like n=1 Tax=Mesoplodon densirostris TaxID=48708 RepID=UPI0028DC812A|nr:actin nucleation-promoting factor WASL-like [Mesoplodon densirostris]